MAQARNTNVGRSFMTSPPAKSKMPPIGGPTGPPTRGIKPKNSRQNQQQESVGGIFNPVQKPISNSLATANNVPVTGGARIAMSSRWSPNGPVLLGVKSLDEQDASLDQAPNFFGIFIKLRWSLPGSMQQKWCSGR